MRIWLKRACGWLYFLALGLAACVDEPARSVVGQWKEQGNAVWVFGADGTVAIKGDTKPSYSMLDETTLRIDFNNLQSLSVSYKIELSESKLILRPEEANGEGALPQDWDEPTILVKVE